MDAIPLCYYQVERKNKNEWITKISWLYCIVQMNTNAEFRKDFLELWNKRFPAFLDELMTETENKWVLSPVAVVTVVESPVKKAKSPPPGKKEKKTKTKAKATSPKKPVSPKKDKKTKDKPKPVVVSPKKDKKTKDKAKPVIDDKKSKTKPDAKANATPAPVESPKKPAPKPASLDDLKKMTVAMLKEKLKENGVLFGQKAKKDELVKLLSTAPMIKSAPVRYEKAENTVSVEESDDGSLVDGKTMRAFSDKLEKSGGYATTEGEDSSVSDL